jgi:photosystem II stability/assembly factor-like uncharacterized protein
MHFRIIPPIVLLLLIFIPDQPEYAERFVRSAAESYDQPDRAMKQWFETTRNPEIGRPTPEKLVKIGVELARGQWRDKSVQPQWVERGPSDVGGRTRAILVDRRDPSGNTVWAGGVSGGLWKCTNFLSADAYWTLVGDGFKSIAISCIVQHPDQPEEMYFSTGEGWFNFDAARGLGIWKSTDGGNSWSQLPSTNNGSFSYVQKLLFDDAGRLLAGTIHSGLLRTADGGNTWQKLLGSNFNGGYSDRVADIELATDGTLYVSFGIYSSDGIYQSTDGGETWVDLIEESEGLPQENFSRIEMATAPSNPLVAYAVFTDIETNESMGIYKTLDGGLNWDSIPEPQAIGMDDFTRDQAWYDLILLVNPEDENEVMVGGIDLHRTTNGGTSWSQISKWNGYPYVHADQHQLVSLFGDFSHIIVGNDGGVFLLKEDEFEGFTPTAKNQNYNITQFYHADLHPEAESPVVIAGSQDNGTQYFYADEFGPTVEVTGGDGGFCHIDQNEPNIQISSYVYNEYFVTNDGWNSYDQVSIGEEAGHFINPTDYDSENNVLFGAYNPGYISVIRGVSDYNRTDTVSLGNIQDQMITAIKVEDNRPNYFYVGTHKTLVQYHIDYENTNIEALKAINFESISGDNYILTAIDVHPADTNQLLMTFGNYGVRNIWYSTDGGFDWENVEGNLPDMPVYSILFNPSNPAEVFLATEMGVWHTNQLDGNRTQWTIYGTGLGTVRATKLRFRANDQTLMVSTYGRGVFTTTIGSVDEVLPTCQDGIQNRDEIAVDCGGTFCPNCPAVPCSTFSDIYQINGPVECGENLKIETGFEVTGNQSFLLYNLKAGSNYQFEFCENFGQWPASLTLWSIDMDEDSSLYFGEILDFVEDCKLEWEAPYSGIYFMIINNTNGVCGEEREDGPNGLLTLACVSGSTTSREEPVWNTSARVYPNPFQESVIIELPDGAAAQEGDFSYQLFHISGAVVQQGIWRQQMGALSFSSGLPVGSYVLTLRNRKGELLFSKSLVKQE